MSYRLERLIGNPETPQNPEIFFKILKPFRDFDNVTSATKEIVTREFNKMFRTNYLPVDILQWHSIKNWAIDKGMNERNAEELELKLWYNPDFLFQAKPLPGTLELSHWLYERHIGFPIITSRMDRVDTSRGIFKNVKEATFAWIKQHEPWVPEKDIFIQENKEMPGNIFKAFMLRKFNCGIYFEDNVEHAKTVLDYTNAIVVLVSNSRVLDGLGYGNLVRISINDGNLPNLVPIYDWVKSSKS
ncbi:hypothetical protein A2W13_03025 [Candidatus Woesebacteria bacterium RBG_16_36_11]|uniref:Uncharacterized protein n=1 Tax=Candidatus Woesebacteria bacterium RBG_16_36_11 TaxID=1802481 RepID=A0A1F7XC98_9BACT|nr:MAG: hypothetical protein A2W13_03025 [Candidatus Woesebacteria bacterium RBG_16_36_11]HJX46017.1 hypothetical protein [Patescibacteria group bacterium]